MRACSSRNSTACPMVTPGIGTAEKVAEGSWLYLFSAFGSVPVSMDTTVDSGICAPVSVAT